MNPRNDTGSFKNSGGVRLKSRTPPLSFVSLL